MTDNGVTINPARVDDLDAVNAIVEKAIMTWNLPDRVKRLSIPSYRYQPHDLDFLRLVIAQTGRGEIVGVAAWEPADPHDAPAGKHALLLHGIYVDPASQGQGIGSRLLDAAMEAARTGDFDGVLVKAQADAEAFFNARGMERIPVENPGRDYPNLFWAPVR